MPPVSDVDAVAVGARVEVRIRFDGRWRPGFETVALEQDRADVGYRIRRLSDGAVLPALFPAEEVRAE
jgi:hypothetical protein